MPNFPLSYGIREHLVQRAVKLSDRVVATALLEFPLKVDQIQATVLPADQLARMRQLDAEGIKTIEHHSALRLAFLKRENLPELKRSAVFHVELPTWIFVGRGTNWAIRTTKFAFDEGHYLVPELDAIPADTRKELVEYVDRVIRQVRLQEIVTYCAQEILIRRPGRYAPTVSHLQALWPTVCTLVDPSVATHTHPRETLTRWVERMRNPSRRMLASYRPSQETREHFRRLLGAADTQLVAGLMLKHPKENDRKIQTYLEHWERLDNDLRPGQ